MRRSSQMKRKLTRCHQRRDIQAEPPQNLVAEADEAEICKGQGRKFFGCYLLTSLSPRYKGHSYIGFTVNPKRRIRQHNGEITSGASHTRMKRPWEMVFCIHGFPTHVAALQFEWAWQHPRESLAVRETASTFKSLGGLANKIKLSLNMLTLPSWQSMNLNVSFFSTKYMNHTAGCPSLPRQMKLHFCSMDELPCYWEGDHPYGCGDKDDIDSNHSEDFSDLGDDNGRFTIQDAIVDDVTVEEDEGHLQSLATDVDIENSTNDEQVQVAKEISTKELLESFHQADSSEKESSSHSALEEDTGIHGQFLADMNEQMQFCKEMWTQELVVPVDKVDPSEGESALKDDILTNESNKECRHMYEQLPVRVGDDVWPSSKEGIEIIDLFTPSPECRIIAGGKKRKAAYDHTDIIDLTRSPLFVQL